MAQNGGEEYVAEMNDYIKSISAEGSIALAP
jgi:hypothetical protein